MHIYNMLTYNAVILYIYMHIQHHFLKDITYHNLPDISLLTLKMSISPTAETDTHSLY